MTNKYNKKPKQNKYLPIYFCRIHKLEFQASATPADTRT